MVARTLTGRLLGRGGAPFKVVCIRFKNRGRGVSGCDRNLGRNRSVTKKGRFGSLITLIRWLLGEALSIRQFDLTNKPWQVPPNLQWRWRSLQIILLLQRWSVRAPGVSW